MKVLHQSNVTIYEPQAVFELCIAKEGEHLKEYMYMHSDNENVHYFKHIITRKYVKVEL